MKKLLLLLMVIAVVAKGQNVDKYIKEEDVTRIIKTLAADDMNGRSATDEKSIGKAAAFIAAEFKNIGLKPLAGLSSYLQEFALYQKIEISALEAKVNGQMVPASNLFLYSEALNVSIDSSQPAEFIDKDKPFRAALRKYFSDTIPKIVFIAPEHEKDFHAVQGYFSGARITEAAKPRKGAIVFILGNASGDYMATATQTVSPLKMMNVAGMIEGTDRKDEFVVFSGHYDHIGIQTAVEGDSIANGADDDASGTTAVIELARYFSQIKKNSRTLIFVAFTAEEIGGYGSRYFSQQLNADKVVAMFNIEMIGKASKWGQNSAFITGYERSDFGQILQKNLAGTKFEFKADPYPEQNLFYRSDNATLARLGVPAHTISTDQIDIDPLYHTVNDEVESLDMKNITSAIKAIALSSKTIVEGKDTPKRIDKSTVH